MTVSRFVGCGQSDPRHRMMRFSLITNLLLLLITLGSVVQCSFLGDAPTHYALTIRPESKGQEVDVQCPLHHALSGDQLRFYEAERIENSSKKVLLRTINITDQTRAVELSLPVRHWSTSSRIYCELWRSTADSQQLVISQGEIRFSNKEGFKQLVYEKANVVRVHGTLGLPLELHCPIRNVTDLGEHDVLWFERAGYQILNVSEKGTLRFEQLAVADLGTYFCTPNSDAQNAGISLPVVKIQLTADGHMQYMQHINPVSGDDSLDAYHCFGPKTRLAQVSWEEPNGAVLVGYNEMTIRRTKSSVGVEQPMLCVYDAFEEAVDESSENETSEFDRPLSRIRRSIHVGPAISVMPRNDPENSTVLLKCDWKGAEPEGHTLVFRWTDSLDGSSEVGKEIYRNLLMDGTMSDVEAMKNSITCEVVSDEKGDVLGSVSMSLAPVSVRTIGTVDLAQIPKRVYGFTPGDSVEMVCRVDREYVQSGKDIKWTFNGGPVPETLNRIDRLKASIILSNDLQPEHEGHYVCHLGPKTLQVQLVQRPVRVELGTEPESDTRWANAGESTEFHCRLSGRENGNQLIDWSFIPKGSDQEVSVQADVNIERPAATPATSFISIHNVQKYHEGVYVCRALELKATSELIVRTRALSVNPEQLDARPGTTVRFLCELSAVSGLDGGKLYWMRADRKDLRPGKEEVIGSTGGRALLIVHSVDWSDHNTTYICTDGVSTAESQIFVREACAPGYRSCNSGGCVSSSKFCDGVQDCEDGTDEDPTKCNECAPNEFRCQDVGDKKPMRNCYLQYWHCDGEDDCGNNFDENNCPPPSEPDACNGTEYICPGSKKPIARAFLCDGVPDCEMNGEDEHECSLPNVIEPSGETQLFGKQSGNLTMTCIVYGKPPPAINWRYNWGHLREGVNYVINNTVVDCNKVISHLTLIDLEPEASGLYTCEAVNKGRTLAPDFSVNVAQGGLCNAPMFNDAAWFEDMCIKCHCSGVTDKCRSAQGYMKSPTDKAWTISEPSSVVRSYRDDGIDESTDNLEFTPRLIRYKASPNGFAFLESPFGLNGSWLTSYGFDLKFTVRLFGATTEHMRGAILALHGPEESIYWCPPTDRVLLYSQTVGYDNELSIRLTERERWFLDMNCTQRLPQSTRRGAFMNTLRNVKKLGIRTNIYEDQVSFELQDMRLEHAVPSDLPGVWVAEIEQCDCPPGYEGLSCEKCAYGYEKHPTELGKCRLRCGCEECDEAGNCLACPGNRSGPRCQQCKPGYYRPDQSSLADDCVPCDKCAADIPYVVKDCMSGVQPEDDTYCKCEAKEDGKLVDPECDQCLIAEKKGIPPPEECSAKTEPSPCNPFGTKSVTGEGECVCKDGYDGEMCDTCSDGYFKHQKRCLGCYCAGQTTSCHLSDKHYFWNVTASDPMGFNFVVWLGQRSIHGGLLRADFTADGKPRLARVNGDVIVQHPILDRGVIHFGINLEQTQAPPPLDSDVPIYRYLYGGQMSFRLDSPNLDPNLLTQGDASVVIELESTRFGRIWTLATYNVETQRYEVEFDENWWPGGWRIGTTDAFGERGPQQGLNRGQLLRVLGTTSSISIVTSSGNSEGLKGMRLSGLSIQVALPITPDRLLMSEQTALSAPVEVCDCPEPSQPGERALSLSCEGCRDPKRRTVVRLEADGDDLGCDECIGPNCAECSAGRFKYNLYTGETYDTCQTGLTIDPLQRRVVVNEGSPVSLVCRATSHHGGIFKHDWIVPDSLEPDRFEVSRHRLSAPPSSNIQLGNQRFNESIHRSESVMRINSAQKSDSGMYICRAMGVGSSVEQPVYLEVRDPADGLPPPSPEEEKLGAANVIRVPASPVPPSFTVYRLERDPSNPHITLVKGTVANPADLSKNQVVWIASNGSVIPMKVIQSNDQTGDVIVQLGLPHAALSSRHETITGYFVGRDPVTNPFWTPMREPQLIDTEADEVTAADIIPPKPDVRIPFMQQHTVPVRVQPGKTPIRVTWTRVGPLPEHVGETDEMATSLPDGVSQDKTDLIIWAGTEQHEGVYEGIVYRDSDGTELTRVNVTVRVDPIAQGGTTNLQPGEAIDLPEKVEGTDEQVTDKPGTTWDFVVQGFTPDAEYCEHPTWAMVDYQTNTVTDVTDRVSRLSPSNFRVEYPLTSGIYLRFQCQPVPKSNHTGEIRFNITSPDPRIVFQALYDDENSTFPTRLVCLDLNPGHLSDVDIRSDSMTPERIKDATSIVITGDKVYVPGDVPTRKVELDWRRIGTFDPFNDSGRFTCFVNNSEASGSKTLVIPSDKVPVKIPEDQYTRVYIYSPDSYIGPEKNGLLEVNVNEGEQLRLYCNYDSRPLGDFKGWRTNSDAIRDGMRMEQRGYSALAISDAVTRNMDGEILECEFGEKAKRVKLNVIPQEKSRIQVKVLSDDVVNDRIIATTRGDLNLTCAVQHIEGKPLNIERIDWFVQYSSGIHKKATQTKLADQIVLEDNGRQIYFKGITSKPTGAKIFCVVRPVDTPTAIDAYHPSPMVEVWIREPKWSATVAPLHRPGVVQAVEAQTLQLNCLVTDLWRNKTARDAEITWETRVVSSTGADGSRKPSNYEIPWLGTKQVDGALMIGGVRNREEWAGEFRCRAEDPKSNASAQSDWVRMEVLAGDTLSRMPKLRIEARSSPEFPFYPTSVECVDDNTEFPSEVTWTRQDGVLPPESVQTKPNSASITWTHGGVERFDPQTDAGVYVCRGTNAYSSNVKQFYLPQDMMPAEHMPISDHRIEITSDTNQIFHETNDRYTRVIQGSPFELLCTYYGHPPPAGGLRWTIDRVTDSGQSTGSRSIAMLGLRVRSGRYYWTEIVAPKFDALGKHTGVYRCEALSQDGRVIKQSLIRVELHKVNVRIQELSDSGVILGTEGDDGVITCNAFDGYFDFILPDAKYAWELEKINGDRINPNMLASTVKVEGNHINYTGLSPAANGFRARCVVHNGTARYVSTDFGFRVRRTSTEPASRPDTEPGVPRWVPGDGTEGVQLVIHGVNNSTGHVSLTDGSDANLTCVAVDAVTSESFPGGEFYFGWRLLGLDGEQISPNQLATGSVNTLISEDGDAGIMLLEDVKGSKFAPRPSAQIQCLATRRAEGVTYYSKPIDFVVYPTESEPDPEAEKKERDERGRVVVKVDGLDFDNTLSASQGSVRTLKCIVTDGATGSRINDGFELAWEFSRLDGTPVDTGAILQPGTGSVEFSGNQITLSGLRQTSAIHGRCRVRLFKDGQPDEDEGSYRDYHSPYFKFDVKNDLIMGHRDFVAPTDPDTADKLWDVDVRVNGLDDQGHLTGAPGEDVELTCQVINKTTGEPITDQSEEYILHHGWEVQRTNGLPGSTLDIASDISIDSKTGKFKLSNLRAQSHDNRTHARCVVELIQKPVSDAPGAPSTKGIRMASRYFVVNVPPADEVVPEDQDPDRTRYELTVRGLNGHGVLPLRQGQDVKLECVVRNIATDTLVDTVTADQMIGWQLPVYPSGFVGNPGDVAREVTSSPKELMLEGIRGDVVDGLRGRCWYYDGLAYYYSRYFPIVIPHSTTDGRIRVEVQEIGSGEDRKYICAAYNSQTGSRLTNVAYEWMFTASNGAQVQPGYFFDSIETRENELTLNQRQRSLRLPEHLRDRLPIEGRCLVLYQPYAGDMTGSQKINIYQSSPFILIHPTAGDPADVLKRPDPLNEGKRTVVTVDEVDRGLVSVPEGGTVTLTCQVNDATTMEPVDGLHYTWEIQQRDGSPVDTGSLARKAVLVQGTGGNQLTLVGIRLRAAGLRGRCVATAPKELATTESSPLKPGEQASSNFFDFDVTRTVPAGTSDAEEEYAGHKDFKVDDEEKRYKVVIGGLDETGRLKAPEGSDVKLEIKVLDTQTGELQSISSDPTITHFGLETQYDNGQSAPFSSLADTVTVHGEDGVVNLNGLRGETKPPTRFRVVVEREIDLEQPDPETGAEKKWIRIASDYVDVVSLKEGEEDKPVPPKEPGVPIRPIIDGLNRCGHLPINVGENATLICRPNDTRIPLDNLIYGWELRHPLGQALPHVNLLAKAVRQESNKLHLFHMMDPGLSLIGRCVIIQTTGKCMQFSSEYFTIGPYGSGCGPNDSVVIPEIPGETPPAATFYNVRIKIEGLDENRQVKAKPGDNVTLKCTALNDSTNEPIPNSAIGWGFVSDTEEPLHAGQLASRYELAENDELRLTGLYANPNARGRCVVSLEHRVTLSSPYFIFDVQDENTEPKETVNPSYSDKRVRVEISGLGERGQIRVNRVGDDASLRCQAIVAETSKPLLPGQGSRYGWEWRYMDEDPVSTTNVAVALEANGERLGLRGIRAPPGTRGRNVKGRCVVHVPANQVDPSMPEDKILVYGSEYFTIDVVKKPTTLDPDVVPIPGRDSDGIKVKVSGLDESGNLVGTEQESVGVTCEVWNASTNTKLSTEGIRAEYNVFYGWEFTDATGRSIDSSLFAESLTTDSSGNLRLRGLAAPRRGDLPFKIRCITVVSKRPASPDASPGPAKSYTSDFFALDITRKDGTSTTDRDPGKVAPDITGDKIRIRVDGLQPDGTLTAQPGEDVKLRCIAEDSETGDAVENVNFGWELRRQTGGMLNMALLANKVVQDGAVLDLSQMKPFSDMQEQARGRCLAYRDRQVYRSPYFRIKVAFKPKDQEIEGDGRITVTVTGVDDKKMIAKIAPNEVLNLTCVARDAETGEILHNVEYGWDTRYKPTADGPELDGTLGPFADEAKETEAGVLVIDGPQEVPREGVARFRCRVVNDSEVYTSQFYRLIPDSAELPPFTPEAPLYPKYRVSVHGLDENGRLSGDTGATLELKCAAYDAKTGTPVEDVKFQWEFKRLDEGVVSSTELVSDSLSAKDNALILEGLKPNRGTVKGRCLAVDEEGWDASPYFELNIISPDEPETDKKTEELSRPTIEKRAEAGDDRVTVTVDGLDADGNFVGTVGSDSVLKCESSVKDGEQGVILSRGWEFLDGHGNPVPITALAHAVTISEKEGTLEMSHLRSSEKTAMNGLKGRCVVRAQLTKTETTADGTPLEKVDSLLFTSENFGISVTEDGTPEEKPGGKDVKGKQTSVTVEGLNQDGAILAETGDNVRLTCIAKDAETGEPITNAIYSWEIRDKLGSPVPTDHLAQRVYRERDTITFIHLKPTDELPREEQRYGRCLAYNRETEHVYRSAYFHLDIRRPPAEGLIDPRDRIQVTVKGIPDDGVLRAQEGDTVVLECEARDNNTKELVPSNEVIYHFQFTEAAPDSEDVYGGHIAHEVKQEPVPGGGSKLTLNGVKADSWHQGRCIVLHIAGGQTIEGDPTSTGEAPKHYVSKYFWSGVTKPDKAPMESHELKEKPVVIGGFTYDPLVIVKADGVTANDTIPASPGEDVRLICYAIDVPTGQPIKDIKYSWELRATDNTPLESHVLSSHIETGTLLTEDGSELRVVDYRPSGEGVRARCVATGTEAASDPKHRGAKYASPIYTFETAKDAAKPTVPPKEPKRRYDPEKLQIEVSGLNPDGTLSKKEGEDVTLKCKVVDSTTGETIEDGFDFGWSIGTGPDARPIPMNQLAQTTIVNQDELMLHGLLRTPAGSGGLRSHCLVRLTEDELERPENYPDRSVTLSSDSFVIHIDQADDVDKTPEKTDELPYTNWIPGKDPKNAVIVKVHTLNEENEVRVEPGSDLTLTCMALDAVSLRRIVPNERMTPVFTWEVRNQPGGELLDYSQLANGQISITQPTPQSSSEDEGVSRITMTNVRRTDAVGQAVSGRCTVRLGEQMFRSPYFHIVLEMTREMEDYNVSPPGFWADDDAIEVIVNGLDVEGNKRVEEGSDVQLNCEARDKRTRQPLTSDQTTYGWQLIDPKNDALMTPLAESTELTNAQLQLNKIYLPDYEQKQFVLWGWCVVDVRTPDAAVKHYRSKPFKMIVVPNDAQATEKFSEPQAQEATDVYVKVVGLSEDGMLKAVEGDNVKVQCRVIDTNTGHDIQSPDYTFGWDWRTLDGGRMDVGLLGQQIESNGHEFTVDNVRSGTPIKGRCVVIRRPTTAAGQDEAASNKPDKQQLPEAYYSDFFFFDVEPQDPASKKREKECKPVDATDEKVTVTVDQATDEEIVLKANEDAELTLSVKDQDGNAVQPTAFSFELSYMSGHVSHGGELAESITFDQLTGKLNLMKVQYPTKPIKIRFAVMIPPTESAAASESTLGCAPIIYRSEYFPLNVKVVDGESKPAWADRGTPVYDVNQKAYQVKIVGLNEEGNAEGTPNEPMELVCTVQDKYEMEAEFKPNAYTWQLIDDEDHPANPGVLAEKVEIVGGKSLKLTNYRPSAETNGLRGRCLISVSVPIPVEEDIHPDMPPVQQYASPYFYFKTKKTATTVEPTGTDESGMGEIDETTPTSEEEVVTEPKEVSPEDKEKETAAHDFSLQLDSPTNAIYETGNEQQQIVLARVQRPFELNCRAIFAEGATGSLSDSGESLPRLVWYYRQPEIPGDVPIPSKLFPVTPPRMETLTIGSQMNHKISIEAEAYSFRDEMAEFHCNAYMESEDTPVASKVVYIQKVKEQFNVRIFDEDSRSRAYAFVGTTKTLTCYVDDADTGERTEPQSYQWEVSTVDNTDEWLRNSSPRQPAETVQGWTSNQLRLEGLKLPESSTVTEATYEFRCIAAHNSTFDTTSRPFVINVRNKPKIEYIRLDREKPSEAVLNTVDVPEDSYDATEDYQLGCKPEVSGSEAVAVWQKCVDDNCTEAKDLIPKGDKLFLFANSTRYTDEGLFRCQVSLQLKEYNFKLTESKRVKIKRTSAPAIYSSDAITYTVNDEMSLQCTDESSSPESTVEWTFEPSGSAPEERKNPIVLGKKYAYGRIYIFAIARGQLMPEHSGKYTCTAKNPYGTASSTIEVTVTEELTRGYRTAYRDRIQRLVPRRRVLKIK